MGMTLIEGILLRTHFHILDLSQAYKDKYLYNQ